MAADILKDGPTPGEPAASDPARTPDGKFRPGHSGNPHAIRGVGLLTRKSKRYHQQRATESEIKDVAEALNLAAHEVIAEVRGRLCEPGDPITVGDLIVFLTNRKALRGGIETFREVFDRTEPKPKRIEVSGDGVAIRAALSASNDSGEREAAEEYFDDL